MNIHLLPIPFYSKAKWVGNHCDSFLARQAIKGCRRLSSREPDTQRLYYFTLLIEPMQQLLQIYFLAFEVTVLSLFLNIFGAFHNSELLVASCSDTKGSTLALQDISLHICCIGPKWTNGIRRLISCFLLLPVVSPALFATPQNTSLYSLPTLGHFLCLQKNPACHFFYLSVSCMHALWNKVPQWRVQHALVLHWDCHTAS